MPKIPNVPDGNNHQVLPDNRRSWVNYINFVALVYILSAKNRLITKITTIHGLFYVSLSSILLPLLDYHQYPLYKNPIPLIFSKSITPIVSSLSTRILQVLKPSQRPVLEIFC